MGKGVVKTKRDEEKWEKAKELAADSGNKENFAYVMGIYKKMKPDYEFKTAGFRPLSYRGKLPTEVSEEMKLWRNGWGGSLEGYIEYHEKMARAGLKDLQRRFDVKVRRTKIVRGGWGDGMRHTQAEIETVDGRNLTLIWQDSHGNGSWHVKGSAGGSALLGEDELLARGEEGRRMASVVASRHLAARREINSKEDFAAAIKPSLRLMTRIRTVFNKMTKPDYMWEVTSSSITDFGDGRFDVQIYLKPKKRKYNAPSLTLVIRSRGGEDLDFQMFTVKFPKHMTLMSKKGFKFSEVMKYFEDRGGEDLVREAVGLPSNSAPKMADVVKFVNSISYMDLEDQGEDYAMWATRENGSVYDGESGEADWDHAVELERKVRAKFPTARCRADVVDEWTHFEVRL